MLHGMTVRNINTASCTSLRMSDCVALETQVAHHHAIGECTAHACCLSPQQQRRRPCPVASGTANHAGCISLRAGDSTIYVHDHRSEPPLRDLLTDFVDAGVAQYVWWNRSWDNWNYTTHVNPQMDVYASCLQNYGPRHQFIGG